MVSLNLSTGENVHFWVPAGILQHFFLFKIIIHQFKLQNLVLTLFHTLLLMMFCAKQGNSNSVCDLC